MQVLEVEIHYYGKRKPKRQYAVAREDYRGVLCIYEWISNKYKATDLKSKQARVWAKNYVHAAQEETRLEHNESNRFYRVAYCRPTSERKPKSLCDKLIQRLKQS